MHRHCCMKSYWSNKTYFLLKLSQATLQICHRPVKAPGQLNFALLLHSLCPCEFVHISHSWLIFSFLHVFSLFHWPWTLALVKDYSVFPCFLANCWWENIKCSATVLMLDCIWNNFRNKRDTEWVFVRDESTQNVYSSYTAYILHI